MTGTDGGTGRRLRPAVPAGTNAPDPERGPAVPAPRAAAEPPGPPPAAGPAGPPPAAEPAAPGATTPNTPEVAQPVRLVRRVLMLPSRSVRAAGRGALHGGRTTRAWSRRASGRFVLPAVSLLAMVAVAAGAGTYAVPATAPHPAPTVSSAPAQVGAPAGTLPPVDPSAAPVPSLTPAPVPTAAAPGAPTRPAAALAAWAGKLSGPLSIPVPALEAYGYAQLAVDQSAPNCHLRWTTLAGIGEVESNHGSTGSATLLPDGRALPPILGPVLDGTHGSRLVRDTDRGRYDGDRTYDRAIGPMQFLPATWTQYGTDADGDGTADPNDIDDAAMTAGRYLCGANRNLDQPGDWWTAVLTYNAVSDYALRVFDAANSYGEASRTVT